MKTTISRRNSIPELVAFEFYSSFDCSISVTRIRLTIFRVTQICFSYSHILTGWIVAGMENMLGCIFKIISTSGGQNNAGN